MIAELKIISDLTARELETMLLPSERVVLAFGADYDKAVGAVGLTDKRVVFKGQDLKEKTLSIGLSKIAQVKTELGGWLSNSYLIIEYSGGEAKLRVHGKDECKALADAIIEATL